MTLDLAKLRAETLALIDDTTPGPWREGQEGNTRVYGPDGMGVHSGLVASFCRRADARLVTAAPALAGTILLLLDEIERLRAENETAVRRSAEWMRNRIAELARQTAANIIAESAGGPRHRRGYEAGRAEAFEIMARTILAVPLPANGAALPEGGPDDR